MDEKTKRTAIVCLSVVALLSCWTFLVPVVCLLIIADLLGL